MADVVDLQNRIDSRLQQPSQTAEVPGQNWTRNLSKRGESIIGDERAILCALTESPELKGLVRFNEFALSVEFTRSPPWRTIAAGDKWTDCDDTELQIYLQDKNFAGVKTGSVAAAVLVAARRQAFHPIRDYLARITWDGRSRLRGWLESYLDALGPPKYLEAIGLRFMVSAVARIMKPGCQADHVLVLEGAQGIGKTSAARALAVRPEWFAGHLPDLHNKDALLQLCGRWIIEISELKAVRNSQVEAVKSFLSQTADTFRPPYGRRTEQFPRQCVFIATTNESEYLKDRTGNRRFWPVRCGSIDITALERDRDQLWAEAVQEFNAGTAWHLTDEETATARDEQGERVYVTELESDVAGYLHRQREAGKNEITVRDVLVYGLNLEPGTPAYSESARKLGTVVAEALESAGWQKVRRAGSKNDKRTIYRFGGQGGQGIHPHIHARARAHACDSQESENTLSPLSPEAHD